VGNREADAIAREIRKMVTERGIRPANIAVYYRLRGRR